jgi:hypothetical protein
MAKPKLKLHIVGGREVLLHLFVRWSTCAMFVGSTLTLHKVHVMSFIAPFFWVELGGSLTVCYWTIRPFNLQYRCGVCHVMPYIIQQLMYVCFLFILFYFLPYCFGGEEWSASLCRVHVSRIWHQTSLCPPRSV